MFWSPASVALNPDKTHRELPAQKGLSGPLPSRLVSIGVAIDDLFDEIEQWGAGFLVTVSNDHRARVVALRPRVVNGPEGRHLRFDSAGRSACANALLRDHVTIAFPPHAESGGYSLLVDGLAMVDTEAGFVDVRPITAVRHRPAPTPPA